MRRSLPQSLAATRYYRSNRHQLSDRISAHTHRFTEGFATRDLVNARQLLHTLERLSNKRQAPPEKVRRAGVIG
jgi:hypothetical protein